ncbi:MAG: biopolymer transporter ExbD [Spirochaetales bacterium]|uniref:Biopolymer transporter ExbD n=1 Tax=Candidatus Thalassospirochaeta sargassi TaxID=3119039 RepID=A0AAJ1IFF0_9SPIO|nr:biopolymer transporter ExbD [Spirochaetales bacterium]
MHFRRRLTPSVKADMVPMIDVVFQLVIFFMVSSTFIQTPGISIVLPESSTSESVTMTKIVVTVVSDEEIYLNKDMHSLESLSGALAAITEEEREAVSAVVIEGDETVSYELLVEVLDMLRLNRFEGVNLRMRDIAE